MKTVDYFFIFTSILMIAKYKGIQKVYICLIQIVNIDFILGYGY